MYKEIDIESYKADFADANADYLLVDVREDYEYEDGHLPGAISIPMSEFQARFDEIEQDKTVILVCATGNRSGMVAEFMVAQGYEDVYNLLDGTVGWMQRGLPIER